MVSVCGGVWVAELINLDEGPHQHNIHHDGVKLETDVAGTDMEDCTEGFLRDYIYTYGVKQAILLWKSNLAKMVRFCSVFFRKEVRLESNQDNENNAIDNVTTVTDDVIEIIKDPPWS